MFTPSQDNAIPRAIADLFTECPVGGAVSFDDINEKIGMDIKENRYFIQVARTIFRKETGGIMSSVRGEGYMRLSPDQYGDAMGARRRRGHRLFHRTHKDFSAAVQAANDITPESLAKIGRELAVAGLVAHLTRDTVVKAIPNIEKPPSYSDIAKKTLEAFRLPQPAAA